MAAITSDDKLIEAENLCTELYRIRDTFFPPVVGEKEKSWRHIYALRCASQC